MSSSSDAVWVPEEEMAAAQEALAWGWGTRTSPELYLSYGMVAMKGMRPALTDAVEATPSFTLLSPLLGVDYFAVLDGGGLGAAGETERLLTLLRDAIAGQVYLALFSDRPLFRDGTTPRDDPVGWWTSAIREAFRIFQDEVAACRRQGEASVDAPAGAAATAIVALVLERYLVIGNCGASKAVLCRDGEFVELSSDSEHMANRGDENKSVDSAGGGRVAFKLATAPRITTTTTTDASGSSSAPAAVGAGVVDAVAVKREAQDEFLILASAAFWDKVTPAAACAHVRRRVGRTSRITMPWETRTDAEGSPLLLADELARKAVHAGSRGNVSVGLVVFRDFWAGPGRTQAGNKCVSVTVPPDLPEAAGTSSGTTEAGEGRQGAGRRKRKPNRKFIGPEWEGVSMGRPM